MGTTQVKISPCPICDKPMEYKTKPPAKCKACKAAEKKIKKKSRSRAKPGQGERSKERIMFNKLDELLPGQFYIRNGYYSFLLSPKGQPMQYDIYYPELHLAFEYDGKQHDTYNPYFHKNKKAFAYLQECDALKNRLSKELGITLIRINYDKTVNHELLLRKMDEAGRLQELREKGIAVESSSR